KVAYPQQPDAAARRDGMTINGPRGLGPRAWWLVQLVGGAPLSFWSATTGMSPAALVDAEVPEAVLLGWERAAERQRNPQWARPVFAKRHSPGLLTVLPPDEGASLATIITASPKISPSVIFGLLNAIEDRWPASLSRAAVERYRQADPFSVKMAAPLLATRLDPAVEPLVEQWA